MKKHILSLILLLLLTSCSNNLFSTPTTTPTSTSIPTSTSTPKPTITATITPSPTPALPTGWDDPKLIAGVRSDFQNVTGMTVEDYFNKAVDEDKVHLGYSKVSLLKEDDIGVGFFNSLGLGTRIIKPNDDKRRFLVMYVAMRGENLGVEIYPLNIGFEEDGVFYQTDLSTVPSNFDELSFEDRVITNVDFTNIEQAKKTLDENCIGIQIHYGLIVRLSSLSTCDNTQPYNSHVDNQYWNYISQVCNTPSNYLNISSQEPLIECSPFYKTITCYAQEYCPSQLIEKGLPETGFLLYQLWEFIPSDE